MARDFIGVTGETPPHRLLLPATAAVPLVLRLADTPYRPPTFLHGVHERFSVLEGDCAPAYLEVTLAPLGAYRVLGCPIRDLGGEIVDLDAVFGAAWTPVAEAVREEPTWQGRFELVERFLLRAADQGPRPSPEVAAAWRYLTASGGRIPIQQVAREVGWSHKRLIARFTEQIGLSPKKAARLARFQRLLQRVGSQGVPDWGQLASECGYADQAHMIREFRGFTGTTPTEFLTRTKH